LPDNDYGVFKSPLEEFNTAVINAALEKRAGYLSHGETYDFEVPVKSLVWPVMRFPVAL
jgi:hypothetical protein